MCEFHYQKHRKHLHATGAFQSMLVPVDDARQHTLQLRAAGVGVPRIAALTGLPEITVQRICQPRTQFTERRVADAILEIDIPTQPLADPALAGGAPVSVVPSQRRIRALAILGHTQDDMLARLGQPTGTRGLSTVFTAQHPSVTVRRHREFAELFDEMVWEPGQSAISARRAAAKGWWGPWAWDDIDDLDCVPDNRPTRVNRRRIAARRARDQRLAEIVADHIEVGRLRPDDDDAVAAILGVTPDALEQRRLRAARREQQAIAS
ncbi:hypothetical protein ACQ856_18115 [Mycolicibacterium psychrotolerans]|uniref:hypothetical protein n=1 Tax=Mycolicibacterium psychrotolerans TaxID=216929 RepID=UPI003D673593